MKKKLPLLIISFTILASLFGHPIFADPAVLLNVTAPGVVQPGQTYALNVSINTQGNAVNAIQVTILADANVVLNPSNVQFNPSVCNGVSSVVSQSPLTLICGSPGAGYNGAGTFVTVFGTAANAPGSATVTLSNPKAAFNAVKYPASGGAATSTIAVPVATAAPTQAPTQAPAQANPVITKQVQKTKSNVTPINGGNPGSLNAQPTQVTATQLQAAQPSILVITQPPIKLPPTESISTANGGGNDSNTTPTKQDLQTQVQGYFNNTLTALLFVLPILCLMIMVAFMSLRMFQMTRRRQREIELLFEHELGELAALESKMDIINEKGDKGKEEFKEEFKRTKDQILKEIKSDYIGSAGDKKKHDPIDEE